MRWFEQQRREWIMIHLYAQGHINRSDIMQKFGIGSAQASRDINRLMKDMPNLMTYNLTAKRYERN